MVVPRLSQSRLKVVSSWRQMWIFLLLFVIFLGKVHHGCGFGSTAFRVWGQRRSLKLLSRFLSYITIHYYSIETRDKGLDQQHSEFEDRDGPWSSSAGSSPQQGRRRSVERCQTQSSRAGIWRRNSLLFWFFFLKDSKQNKRKKPLLNILKLLK